MLTAIPCSISRGQPSSASSSEGLPAEVCSPETSPAKAIQGQYRRCPGETSFHATVLTAGPATISKGAWPGSLIDRPAEAPRLHCSPLKASIHISIVRTSPRLRLYKSAAVATFRMEPMPGLSSQAVKVLLQRLAG